MMERELRSRRRCNTSETGHTIGPRVTALDWRLIQQRRTKKSGKNRIVLFGEITKEASVGVEPTIADLQSAALATWPRRLNQLSVLIAAEKPNHHQRD